MRIANLKTSSIYCMLRFTTLEENISDLSGSDHQPALIISKYNKNLIFLHYHNPQMNWCCIYFLVIEQKYWIPINFIFRLFFFKYIWPTWYVCYHQLTLQYYLDQIQMFGLAHMKRISYLCPLCPVDMGYTTSDALICMCGSHDLWHQTSPHLTCLIECLWAKMWKKCKKKGHTVCMQPCFQAKDISCGVLWVFFLAMQIFFKSVIFLYTLFYCIQQEFSSTKFFVKSYWILFKYKSMFE